MPATSGESVLKDGVRSMKNIVASIAVADWMPKVAAALPEISACSCAAAVADGNGAADDIGAQNFRHLWYAAAER